MTIRKRWPNLPGDATVVTFEFENVPLGAAHGLAGGATPLHPPARALEVAQDRLTEKNFLNGLGIATARFHSVDTEQDAQAALERLEGGAILKKRAASAMTARDRSGFHPTATRPLASANWAASRRFMEAEVDFDCEISIVAARDAAGQVAAFEPARNVHRDGHPAFLQLALLGSSRDRKMPPATLPSRFSPHSIMWG